GKYHQVKRMFTAVGNKIVYLKRISMGNLQLDENLSLGEYKFLDDADLQKLIM
ncbi:MAG: 16S rRNA pseudouridine(516) synthase, partial [Spirochaetia bacterium]|nr:16S rRNA pseudouridine(516) synthase [Spirochaetia bacterium]